MVKNFVSEKKFPNIAQIVVSAMTKCLILVSVSHKEATFDRNGFIFNAFSTYFHK